MPTPTLQLTLPLPGSCELAPVSQSSPVDPTRFRNGGRLIAFFRVVADLSRNELGYCVAGNDWLTRRFGISVMTLTRWIDRLVQLGALAVEQIEGVERRMWPVVSLAELTRLLFRFLDVKARVKGDVKGDVKGLPIETSECRDNEPARAVVVSAPSAPAAAEVQPDPEADRRAEEAARAYAQKHPVRCWEALLRVARWEKWTPPAPPSTYSSDLIRASHEPVKRHKVPAERREASPQERALAASRCPGLARLLGGVA